MDKKATNRLHTHCKPILLSSDRKIDKTRKRKSLSWRSDEAIQKVHYFELIADERVNVSRPGNYDQQQSDTTNASALAGSSSLNTNNKFSDSVVGGIIANASVDPAPSKQTSGKSYDPEVGYCFMNWPSKLIMIDYTPELPSPGWDSIERSAQAERESYSLGAIDLPGQPSTLDEPEHRQSDKQEKNPPVTTTIMPPQSATTATITATAVATTPTATTTTATTISTNQTVLQNSAYNVKIVPLDAPHSTFHAFTNMYDKSDIVDGVKQVPLPWNLSNLFNQPMLQPSSIDTTIMFK